MSMTTQSISPLWETMPLQKTAPAAEKPAAGSLFADIFKAPLRTSGRRRTTWRRRSIC